MRQHLSALALSFLIIAACEPAPQPVTISFHALVGSSEFACGQSYAGVGSSATQLQPSDFRLYVHNVRLIDAAGNEQALTLEQDRLWQYQNVALLDFEDKTAPCDGTTATNFTVRGQAPAGVGGYAGVRFVVGVPPELNHGNQATAPAPLNLSGLFWTWEDGYKFLRTEGKSAGGAKSFLMHLGSTDCVGKGGGQTECANLNTPEIQLTGFDPQKNRIGVDLAALLAGSDLSAGMSCHSEESPVNCGPVFQRLGLPLGSAPAGTQTFFRVE